MNIDSSSHKRPGSPLGDLSLPATKIPKTGAGEIQINYLRTEKRVPLPLVVHDDPLPRILDLMSEYDGVLQRHESLAGNLGACPIGPILLRGFERVFVDTPRILKTNGKDPNKDPNITWLDVVEFAQNKPEQFNLEKMRNGVRVCQFYLKQCRVEISEESYVLIHSGMPQKLIPPQPIPEDEEKELGVIQVLDKNLTKVVQMADQAAMRARSLIHKMKSRHKAIEGRRQAEGEVPKVGLEATSPLAEPNGIGKPFVSQSPPTGFTAVNVRPSTSTSETRLGPMIRELGPSDDKARNGNVVETPFSRDASSPVTRVDWMNKFLTPSERAAGITADTVRRDTLHQFNAEKPSPSGSVNAVASAAVNAGAATAMRTGAGAGTGAGTGIGTGVGSVIGALTGTGAGAGVGANANTNTNTSASPAFGNNVSSKASTRRQSEGVPERVSERAKEPLTVNIPANSPTSSSSVPIPNTPASLMPAAKPHILPRDDGGPHKAEMITRMETMQRGERIIPPCDRCRRLQMDCIKNLTACQGCTKKHAKCAWKEVTPDELQRTAGSKPPVTRPTESRRTSVPTASDWDKMLRQGRSTGNPEGSHSPQSRGNDTIEVNTTVKNPVSQVASPRARSRSHGSPRLDVRPPPRDSQSRDVADKKHDSHLSKVMSYGGPPAREKLRPLEDEGDRLAAVAAQVYRSASQQGHRISEA